MSFDFNYKFWVATKKDLNILIKRQNKLKLCNPIQNPLFTFKILSEIYILYVELVKRLTYLYQNTHQVQKVKILRNLTEAASSRLSELKYELKNLEFSECVYLDGTLISRKLTPFNLAVWSSPYFLYRRPTAIQNFLYNNEIFMTTSEEEKLQLKFSETLRNAVNLIQVHERARSSRAYRSLIEFDKNNLKIIVKSAVHYEFSHSKDQPMSIPVKRTLFKTSYLKSIDCGNKNKTFENNTEKEDDLPSNYLDAVLIIQKCWRAYKARKQCELKRMFCEDVYGMAMKKPDVNPKRNTETIFKFYEKEVTKNKFVEDFQKLIESEGTRLLQQRSPWIMEDISDQIRGWFKEFYERAGNFHPYPDAAKSGTILLLTDETMNIDEFKEYLNSQSKSKAEKQKQAENQKLKNKKMKENLIKQKIKEAKRRKKLKDSGFYDIAYEIESNKNTRIINETMKQYSNDWRNVEEYLNNNSDPIKEWVSEDALVLIHKELRGMVDEYMRIEFELLRKAWCIDNKQKYKPSKKKGIKAKKPKRAKKTTDLIENRTLESLYGELKDSNIIEEYKHINFKEFIADFNYISDNTRDENHFTTYGPLVSDVKMVIEENILGMGEFNVNKPKSMCLIGPPNCGKKFLCEIVTAELDALFMNLSPEKTHPFSHNLNYFIQVVMKVAKLCQPTIIFIENAERIFWKKIPKDQLSINPTLLESVLVKKIIKSIKNEDRIMVLGTSDAPWSAKGTLKKAFQKFLLIPPTDYGTVHLLMQQLVLRRVNETTNLSDYQISAMAKVFRNYATGDVASNVINTLDVRRRMQLQSNFLQPNEFIEHFLSNTNPMLPQELKILEKLAKWFKKSNEFSKMRMKFLENKAAKQKKK